MTMFRLFEKWLIQKLGKGDTFHFGAAIVLTVVMLSVWELIHHIVFDITLKVPH